MKSRKIVFSTVAAFSLVAAAAWWTYKEERHLDTSYSSVLDGAEDKDVALVNFERKDFGKCVVQHAWIEKAIAVSSRQALGIEVDVRKQDVALVYVVVKSVDEGQAPDLTLMDSRTRSWFAGSSGYWTELNGSPAWVTMTRAEFPTPDTLEFRCGSASMKASVKYRL